MIRPLSLLFLLWLGAGASFAAGEPAEVNVWAKKDRPPKPEADGLRLEISARLDDSMMGTGDDYAWAGGFLAVEVALHNISPGPITVATTASDEKPMVQDGEPGLERIVFVITPDRFRGKPAAFVAARFTPVVLAPDESVLLLKHRVTIKDRKRSDELKEVSVAFVVSSGFNGPKDWWRGSLQAYETIRRGTSADQQIAESKAYQKEYAAQKEAEKDPHYGATNAARMAALIASADEVTLRGEGAKDTEGVVVRDLAWIRQVSEAVAATSLPRAASCFCIGWRTAYFKQKGEPVVSVAAIHGNQLRIHWSEGGGDYVINEADWKAVKQALEIPAPAGQDPTALPDAAH